MLVAAIAAATPHRHRSYDFDICKTILEASWYNGPITSFTSLRPSQLLAADTLSLLQQLPSLNVKVCGGGADDDVLEEDEEDAACALEGGDGVTPTTGMQVKGRNRSAVTTIEVE